jgi:hypothetical protein
VNLASKACVLCGMDVQASTDRQRLNGFRLGNHMGGADRSDDQRSVRQEELGWSVWGFQLPVPFLVDRDCRDVPRDWVQLVQLHLGFELAK